MQHSLWNNLIKRQHYAAVWASLRVYSNPADGLYRYLFHTGKYPAQIGLRTPIGEVRPTLYHRDDMLTANLVFCREDYAAREDISCVVDLGSNIGLSVLYFMTRNRRCRVWAYEPVPQNIVRLKHNLEGFDRFVLEETAVANVSGTVQFGVEPTGIYGGIGVAGGDSISVSCRHINDVLEQVLSREQVIDILKLDIEGSEITTFEAIAPAFLSRIHVVYLEGFPPPQYGFTQRGGVAKLVNHETSRVMSTTTAC